MPSLASRCQSQTLQGVAGRTQPGTAPQGGSGPCEQPQGHVPAGWAGSLRGRGPGEVGTRREAVRGRWSCNSVPEAAAAVPQSPRGGLPHPTPFMGHPHPSPVLRSISFLSRGLTGTSGLLRIFSPRPFTGLWGRHGAGTMARRGPSGAPLPRPPVERGPGAQSWRRPSCLMPSGPRQHRLGQNRGWADPSRDTLLPLVGGGH